MPSVNITEKEYQALCQAVFELKDNGYDDDASLLDEFARKANKSISIAKFKNALVGQDLTGNLKIESPLETRDRLLSNNRPKI